MIDKFGMTGFFGEAGGFRFAQGMALFVGVGPSTSLRSAQDDGPFCYAFSQANGDHLPGADPSTSSG